MDEKILNAQNVGTDADTTDMEVKTTVDGAVEEITEEVTATVDETTDSSNEAGADFSLEEKSTDDLEDWIEEQGIQLRY